MSSYAPIAPLPVRTRSAIGPRDLARFPVDDDALGPSLYGLVEDSLLKRGYPRPVVLGIGAEHIEQYDLVPVVQAGADLHRFIAAVAGQPGIEVVAVAGGVQARFRRDQKEPRRAILAFLEWPDGRWWSGLRPLEDGGLREDWPLRVHAAIEGDPRPRGMGAWFSRARFEGLCLRPATPDGEAPLVH